MVLLFTSEANNSRSAMRSLRETKVFLDFAHNRNIAAPFHGKQRCNETTCEMKCSPNMPVPIPALKAVFFVPKQLMEKL